MTRSNIAAAINAAHEQAEAANREGLVHAAEAGRLLIEAKATTKHGAWEEWIAANCQFSVRTAQLYMKVAKSAADPAKAQRVAGLSLREAARATSTPRDTKANPKDTLAEAYGPDEAVQIRFALDMFEQGHIDQTTMRKLTSVAGMTPEKAGQDAVQMIMAIPDFPIAQFVAALAKNPSADDMRKAFRDAGMTRRK